MATKNPTHTVYSVRDYAKQDGEVDAAWTRVGAAWVHADGKGFNIALEALPVNGRLVLRLNKPKPKKAED
jgi:hypothetical protein